MTDKFVVLYVEDSLDNHFLFSLYVKSEPYELKFATKIAEALEVLESNKIDVILLDWHLPGEYTGVKAVQKLAGDYPDIPIIIVTGTDKKDLEMDMNKAGVKDILNKPVRKEDLLLLLDEKVAV